jgi:hypothetical protein
VRPSVRRMPVRGVGEVERRGRMRGISTPSR